jgi:3-oxoacyl-[acyl-carrier protein] reductase
MAKRAVVSGGGTGIGAAIARALVADGYRVVIVGRRAAVLEATAKEIGDAVVPATADLTVPSDVERLVSTVDGPMDVPVNHAGRR